jgi:DNA polymerase III sliding clamp (beta) subunit (PCNA family)
VGRLECRAAILQQALAGAALAVARHPPLPILDQVLLQLTGATLTLTTTNLEVAVRWEVAGTSAAPAALASSIPFRPLHRWVRRRKPDEPITLTLTLDGPAVQVRVAGRGSYLDLSGAPAAEFPTVPADPLPGESAALQFDRASLLTSLPRVQYAAAASESPLPLLHSVGWRAAAGAATLQLGAADGYRGALITLPLPAPVAGPDPLAYALPVPASTALTKLLTQVPLTGTPPWGVLYCRARQQALFVLTPAVRLLARFRPLPYPDLATQVPASWQTRATVDRANLQAAVVTIQAALAGDLARLRLQALPASAGPGGQVILTAWGARGPGAAVTLDALVVGPGGERALAPAYLAAALAAIPTPQAVLDLPDAGGACLVRPVPARGTTHLIMPMVL